MDERLVGGVSCSDGVSCSGEDQGVAEGTLCIDLDESCVDIELVAEQLPTIRLMSETSIAVPQTLDVALVDCFQIPEPSLVLLFDSVAPRAPPLSPWLTDVYLRTIVLQV